MLQFRPRGSISNDPYYAPHRDLAYVGPGLVTIATKAAIECAEKEPWYNALLNYFGVSKAALEQYAPTLAQLFTMLDRDIKDALKQSGFSSLPPAVQAGFYIKLGQTLLAAIHCGLRDITTPGDTPRSVEKMIEDIREAVKKVQM